MSKSNRLFQKEDCQTTFAINSDSAKELNSLGSWYTLDVSTFIFVFMFYYDEKQKYFETTLEKFT